MGAAGRFGSLKMVGDCKSPARRAWSFARLGAGLARESHHRGAHGGGEGLVVAHQRSETLAVARDGGVVRGGNAAQALGVRARVHDVVFAGARGEHEPIQGGARARARASTMALARIRRRIQFHVIQLTIARLAQPLAVVGARLHPPLGKRGVVQHALLAVAQRDRGGRGIRPPPKGCIPRRGTPPSPRGGEAEAPSS